MSNLLGTVVASPIVQGASDIDAYGTHYAFLGVGGYQEYLTIAQRNALPIDPLNRLGDDGLSSGRRRLGMLVYVPETDITYKLTIPYATWTGLTIPSKVAALANNANWLEFTGGGGGDAIKKKYQKTAHGFTVGTVVAYDGTTFVKKIASAGNADETLGLISKVDDVNNFTVTYAGFIDTTAIPGISANTVYYVSPQTLGAITPFPPIGLGEENRPILITQTLTTGLVVQYRGDIITENDISGSTASGFSNEKLIHQTGHGFALGDVLKYTGTTYQKAIATEAAKHFTVGQVTKVVNADDFKLTFGGYVTGMAGAFDSTGTKHLSGGTTYYLSPTVAGKLTRTRPTGVGQLILPIYQAIGTNDGIVINQKGLPAQIQISGVTGLQTALNSKVNNSLIGSPNGIAPLDSNTLIPIQFIPPGLKEEYVVPTIGDRTAKFYVSGGTGTTGQVMSFRGLKVFVLNATGAPELPTGYTGSSEFIDTTGLLNWSATTNVVHIRWNDITGKPATFVNKINSGFGITRSNNGTGTTTLNVLVDNKYVSINTGNSITVKPASLDVTRLHLQGPSGTTGQLIARGTGSTFQVIAVPAGGAIGPAEDGSYTDGLFTDFTPSTPVGTAVDRFNEILKALAPSPAPDVSQATGSGSFLTGFLSFGSSKAIAGFTNVGTNAGNAAVDINGNYTIAGTRLGLTNNAITGVINSSVVGGAGNIPYANTAFNDGDKGKLILYRNGTILSQLVLSATTASTSNAYMSVTAVDSVKFPSGAPLNSFKYRTGTFNFPVSAMTNGYNYIRIIHTGATFSRVTNFLEWVYDNDASNITLGGTTGLTNVTLSGTKYISGVKYYTGGSVQYQGTFANVYKNVYSNLSNAIDFSGKENIGALSTMDVTGAGIVNRLSSALQTLPILNTAATNPQNTNIAIAATFPITASILVGNVGITGRLRSSVSVAHPFTAQAYAGGQSTMTGFLFNNTTQPTVLNNETFDGETDRLEARDYSVLTYSNVNGGTYAWTSSQNLLSGNAQHNTGLLVFNGELMYPNASYLTSTYGITTGNFGAVSNAPAGNPNYTSATLKRDHYRKFKSANGSTQSTLTFTIAHSGTNTDFLTNGGTGGTPSANTIKFEFLIMRSGGQIHGWANPFGSSGNPEGIAVTSSSHSGGVTTVTCTLATTPRVAINDIVIVRMFTSSSYSNRIQNLAITNI